MQHLHEVKISFGDCDPAGIVFYPNAFRWMDATFHDFLRQFGGHAALCRQMGATGVGLADARAQFRSPMRDGDLLTVHMTVTDWGARTITMSYRAMIQERLAFEGQEVRCVFMPAGKDFTAGEMAEFKALIGA